MKLTKFTLLYAVLKSMLTAKTIAAKKFLKFMSSNQVQSILKASGYTLPATNKE